jgi:peptide-methionine (R)-S-oxide reductase
MAGGDMTTDNLPKDDAEWRKKLTPEQYEITRCSATERPFTGPWLDEKREGTFVCVCCDTPLFRSDTKYESGSGWPSFFDAIGADVIATREDLSHGVRRIEILCAKCDAHLGHIFPDGPKPTGLRYCTNGHALDFKPDAG